MAKNTCCNHYDEEEVSLLFRYIEEGVTLKDHKIGNLPEEINRFRSSDGLSPLHLAVFNNQFENCLWLLEHGSDVNQFTKEIGRSIETPLHIACSINVSSELFDLLIENGANVNLRTPDHGFTPLHKVTKGVQDIHGQAWKLKILLEKKANPLINSSHGMSPISHFLPNLNEEHVKIAKQMLVTLVQYGINIDLQDVYGNTALLNACTFGNIHVIKLLLELNADVHLRRGDGYTLLHELCLWECFRLKNKVLLKECFQVLLNKGLEINATALNGQTPLHITCQASESTEMLELLISLGADIHAKDSWGKLPAHDCKNEFLNIFIQHGIDINSQDLNGQTILMCAVKESKKDIVETLVKAKASPNLREKCGRSALHFLSDKNEDVYEILKLLINSSGDLEAQDKYGITPLDYYAFFEDETIRKLNNILALSGFQIPAPNSIWKDYSTVKSRVTDYFRVPMEASHNFDEEKIPLYDGNLLQDVLDTPGIGTVDSVPCFRNVGNQVEVLITRLAEKMNSLDPHFSFIPSISGGVREGTKVGFPDEFDYLVYVQGLERFFDIEENGNTEDGYANLKLKGNSTSPIKFLVDEHGYFLTPHFTSYFYELVFRAMRLKEIWQDIDLYWEFKRIFDLHKSNLYIALRSPVPSFPDIDISIDFVPVFKVPNWRPKNSRDLSLYSVSYTGHFCLVLLKFFAKSNIPVVRYPKFNQVRASSSEIEASIINKLPRSVKMSFTFLKAIKNLCIFFFYYVQYSSETASDHVSTYLIKNSLFYHAAQLSESPSCEHKVVIRESLVLLYRILQGVIVGRFPSFFVPGILLISEDDYQREKVGNVINQLVVKLIRLAE